MFPSFADHPLPKLLAEGLYITLNSDDPPMFNTTPEGMLRSPMTLIGTPDECIAELKRRERDWDVSQVLFGGGVDPHTQQRLAEEVLKHV